jgi:hypothetical protein
MIATSGPVSTRTPRTAGPSCLQEFRDHLASPLGQIAAPGPDEADERLQPVEPCRGSPDRGVTGATASRTTAERLSPLDRASVSDEGFGSRIEAHAGWHPGFP